MSKITAEIDARGFDKAMRALARETGKTVAKVLQEQGRLAAREYVNVLPPMSTLTGKEPFNQQRRLGLAAVARDIRKVYVPAYEVFDDIKDRTNEMLADWFWLASKKDPPTAEAIVREHADQRFRRATVGPLKVSHYKSARSSRTGRVHGEKYARQIVTDPGSINRLIKEKQKRVGFLKSGAAAAVAQAGFSAGVPGWITSQSGSGRGQAVYTGSNPFIKFETLVPYAAVHNKGDRLINVVLGNRKRHMTRQMKSEGFQAWRRARSASS